MNIKIISLTACIALMSVSCRGAAENLDLAHLRGEMLGKIMEGDVEGVNNLSNLIGEHINDELSPGFIFLDFAVRSKSPEMVAALLKNPFIDVNKRLFFGYTSLMTAVCEELGHPERDVFSFDITRQLLQAGADVNAQDERGVTALMNAACSENPQRQVIELLLMYNTDLNLQKKDGNTVLMRAIQSGHKEVALFILRYALKYKRNLDLLITNDEGKTAIDIAREFGVYDYLRRGI